MRILSIDSSLGTQLAVVETVDVIDAVDVADMAGMADAAGPGGRDKTTGGRVLRVLSRAEQTDTRRHAESLGQMLTAALGDPGVAAHPLDAVVAATGPAPFTGLRAGLVTARVVGRTRGVPVHGVSSLDAVARRALDELGARSGERTGRPDQHRDGNSDRRSDWNAERGPVVLVATDARRREVYAALFRANGPDDVTRLTEVVVCAPDRVAQRLAAQAGEQTGEQGADGVPIGVAIDVIAGSGAAAHPELVDPAGRREVLAPVSGDALAQVRIALARLERGEELGTEPLYLRHAEVQMPAARKRVH